MKHFSSQNGSTFLTTMICTLLMTTACGYIYKTSSQNSHFANELRKSTQAQMVAEAGLAKALSQTRTSWSAVSGGFSSGSIGNGTHTTTVSSSGGRYLIKTTGTVQNHSRVVSAEVRQPSGSVLNYAFAAGGNLDLDSGTGQSSGAINGDVYAGGNMTLDGPPSGGLLAITGNAYSNGSMTTSGTATVSGSSTANWSQVESFPVIDYSYYQAIASANGQYINGNVTYASGAMPSSPAGGVIYVNGNVTIRGTQSTTACIVATGNIQIEKSGSTYPRITVNQYSNYPAMLVQGNIQFSSTGNGGAYLTTTGLVYAAGNIQLSSGNHDAFSFTGSVIARGNIQTTGLTAWNTLNGAYANQSPPGISVPSTSSGIVSYNQ